MTVRSSLLPLVVVLAISPSLHAWQSHVILPTRTTRALSPGTTGRMVTVANLFAQKEAPTVEAIESSSVENTTEKYGLEAGLLKASQKNDGGESAKSLLKKYGVAYLATSIPLALLSFCICYALVDNGVEVSTLLAKVGIEGQNTDKVGTFAIAYAAHKAASPIRFPPTVLLTPVVANLIGKEPNEVVDGEE